MPSHARGSSRVLERLLLACGMPVQSSDPLAQPFELRASAPIGHRAMDRDAATDSPMARGALLTPTPNAVGARRRCRGRATGRARVLAWRR